MAKETIRRLSDDVGRILVAGAHLAPADPDLKKDHEALLALAKQVGDKAPVIGKLAEGAGKAINGSGKTAAAEVIALATMAAQVKAAQAAPAAPRTLDPLPAVPPVPTACNAKDLDDLYAALTQKGQGRKEVIERAIEGGYIVDLRLVEALIYAMGDPWIGDVVSDHAIPRLGRAVVNPIRQRLNLKGTNLDARRLRALVAVQKQDAIDVLGKAVQEGSAPVREAAMDAIADHVSGVPEFEQYALAAIAKDKSNDIKRAAIRALGGYASDASLEATLDALDKVHLTPAAAEALGKSKNPKAVERILARLGEAVVAAKAPVKKAKVDAKAKDASNPRERAKQLCELLLGALGHHQDPAIARLAMELIDGHGAAAAWAAVGSADRTQLARLADLLAGDDEELFPPAVAAAVKLGGEDAFKRLSAPFAAKSVLQKLKGDKYADKRMDAALAYFASNPGAIDKRWCDLFLEVLEKGSRDHGIRVVAALGNAREKRATQPLLGMLASEKKEDAVVAIIQALGQIGDPVALDPILAKGGGWATRYAIRDAVLRINHPSSIDKVRTMFVGLKNPDAWESWHIRSLLRDLETRFPGC